MKKTKLDHLVAIGKAGISAIPIAGGPIASLISDYVPETTQRHVEAAFRLFEERIRALEDRIDVDGVNEDEFAELFKSCYMVMLRTHREEKLRGAANLLSNILLAKQDPQKMAYSDLDHFVRALESLSAGAIEVLGHIYSRVPEGDRSHPWTTVFHIGFPALNEEIFRTDPSLLMGLLGELDRFNLVRREAPQRQGEGYGGYTIVLTPLGARFAAYVLGLED